MDEVILMDDSKLDEFKWCDGEYRPGTVEALTSLVMIRNNPSPIRYAFPNVPIESTLASLKVYFKDHPELIVVMDDKETEVFIQARHYIPGPYYDQWDRVEKIGRYSNWVTITTLR